MRRAGWNSKRARIGWLAAGMGVLLVTGACAETASTSPAATPENSVAASVQAPVAKVVFVGQKDCCDCTRARIQASWAALEQALAGKPDIAIERLDFDGDSDKVAEIEKLGKIMVVPGLYLLAADGKLVRQFQGEVSREQVAESL